MRAPISSGRSLRRFVPVWRGVAAAVGTLGRCGSGRQAFVGLPHGFEREKRRCGVKRAIPCVRVREEEFRGDGGRGPRISAFRSL